ncbi:hypothetical protein GCM10009816_13610 [Microbacterium aquimaris]
MRRAPSKASHKSNPTKDCVNEDSGVTDQVVLIRAMALNRRNSQSTVPMRIAGNAARRAMSANMMVAESPTATQITVQSRANGVGA